MACDGVPGCRQSLSYLAAGQNLQLFTPSLIHFDERLPRHCLLIVTCILPINAANFWPHVIDATRSIHFVQVSACTIAAVHRGGFRKQMNAAAAFHAPVAGERPRDVRHTHPWQPGIALDAHDPR